MQITNNQSNLNFSGSFRIPRGKFKAQHEIPQLFTQGRQIFYDIKEDGDMFIVLRDNYDRRVAKYIKENNVSGLEYYPEINTKSGLDDQKPEGLIVLLKEKSKVIKANLSEAILGKKPVKYSVSNAISKISDALRLHIENPIISSNKSFTRVRDEQKCRTIELVAPTPASTYVKVIPDSLNETSTKCIIDAKGNIIKMFETPDEIHRFNVMFNNAKKKNVNILVNK